MIIRKQENIITDLIIDNGLIVNDMNNWLEEHNPCALARANSIVNYCHILFMETVYDATNTNKHYIQNRLVDLLSGIANYRKQYGVGTSCYILFNSLFDKTAETFNDFMKTC